MALINNLLVEANADFTVTVELTNEDADGNLTTLDLTGYTALAQIRKRYGSSSVSETFTVAFTADRTSGKIALELTDVQTGTLKDGRFVWDLQLTDAAGNKTRTLEGRLTVLPSVSRV
jgi:hypothetical protein